MFEIVRWSESGPELRPRRPACYCEIRINGTGLMKQVGQAVKQCVPFRICLPEYQQLALQRSRLQFNIHFKVLDRRTRHIRLYWNHITSLSSGPQSFPLLTAGLLLLNCCCVYCLFATKHCFICLYKTF